MEDKRNCRLVSILIVSLSLSFATGCASLNTGLDRSLPQSCIKYVDTHETKKYVRIVCSPLLCVVLVTNRQRIIIKTNLEFV